MTDEGRVVTIDVREVPRIPSRSHACWIVSDPAEYVPAAAAFLTNGRARREKLFAFGPHDGALAELMDHAEVMTDPHLEFLAGGPLEPELMFEAFREHAARARDEGYDGIRVVADMDWLMGPRPSTKAVVGFELLLDRLVQELGLTVVCAYRVATFDAETISGVQTVHPVVAGAEPPPFRLVAGDGGVWRLSGEIDLHSAPPFQAAIQAATGVGSCVLDLSELAFMDVAGMRVFAAECAAGEIELRGVPEWLRRAWGHAAFDRIAPLPESPN